MTILCRLRGSVRDQTISIKNIFQSEPALLLQTRLNAKRATRPRAVDGFATQACECRYVVLVLLPIGWQRCAAPKRAVTVWSAATPRRHGVHLRMPMRTSTQNEPRCRNMNSERYLALRRLNSWAWSSTAHAFPGPLRAKSARIASAVRPVSHAWPCASTGAIILYCGKRFVRNCDSGAEACD